MEAIATLVLSCAPHLTAGNYANNLYHCSLVLRRSCSVFEESLIITSNYTGMRITGNLQVAIILFIIFEAIKVRNAVFIV